MSRGRDVRRAYGIRGYVGPNGHGKSLAMIHDVLPSLERGRHVLSNVRLLDYLNPRPCDDQACTSDDHQRHQAAHPLYIPLTDYGQLLEARNCELLLDEVTGIASSRESNSLPFQVVNLLVQLRRRDVTLSWTAPSWARADKVLREVSQIVVDCRGSFAKKRGEGDAMWLDRRLFRWVAFDAASFTDWSEGKKDKAKKVAGEWHWRTRHEAFTAYDTYDTVTALGWALESGLCIACGGRRSVPRCSCESHAGAGSGHAAGGSHLAPVRLSRAERAAVASQSISTAPMPASGLLSR